MRMRCDAMLPAGDGACSNKTELLLDRLDGCPCFRPLPAAVARRGRHPKIWQIGRHFHSHQKGLPLNQRPQITGACPLKQRIGPTAGNSAFLTGCAAEFGLRISFTAQQQPHLEASGRDELPQLPSIASRQPMVRQWAGRLRGPIYQSAHPPFCTRNRTREFFSNAWNRLALACFPLSKPPSSFALAATVLRNPRSLSKDRPRYRSLREMDHGPAHAEHEPQTCSSPANAQTSNLLLLRPTLSELFQFAMFISYPHPSWPVQGPC